tara:strand:+ start:95828 stop:96550 length:723 start_codon:yes stop_codon:yes gene_type:complete
MIKQSVVQLDMDANLLLASNSASFATTKEQAKEILGSAEKIGNYLLLGDAVNKRAFIEQLGETTWEYNSNHYVSDFHITKETTRSINVNDGDVSEEIMNVNQNMSVTWTNNSNAPILIYSGSTDYDTFYADPDLSNYGQTFQSGTLSPGDTYTFQFQTITSVNWFVYPTILTGEIVVSEKKITAQDEYVIVENDGKNAPMSSRIVKVDSKGNVNWSFGEAYLIKPKDARPLINGNTKISV